MPAHPTTATSTPTAPPSQDADAVVFDKVSFAFDDHVVLDELSLHIPAGSMTILLGASGAGKSIMLKLVLGLLKPDAGAIFVHGRRIDQMTEPELMRVRADIGMLFQESALFDSLTVEENVGYRLSEETETSAEEVHRRVAEVLGFVGLADYLERMPSELSGGQRRRVAIARAMAARPRLLLLDDPTSGLDPITSTTVDDEIVKLRDLERFTSIVVTHQIRDAHYVANHQAVRDDRGVRIEPVTGEASERARFMVLHHGRLYFEGNSSELLSAEDPFLREFLFMTLPPW